MQRISWGRWLAAMALSVAASCALAAGALAADQLWWSNRTDPANARIVRAAMDGSGAVNVVPSSVSGRVNTSVADPSRNKLYWMERNTGKLWVSALDGSNPTVLLEGAGAGINPSSTMYSLSIDPVAQKLYWVNGQDNSIRWANTDGSLYGTLYSPIAGKLANPNQLVIDREHNRIWWANYTVGTPSPAYGYAKLDGSGGAQAIDPTCVSTTGGPSIQPENGQGMVVDYTAGKIYGMVEAAAAGLFMVESNLDGSGCRQITPPTGTPIPNSYGLALDPGTRWLYNARPFSPSDPLMEYLDLNASLPAPALSVLPISPSSFANGARYPFIIKEPKLASGSISISGSGTAPGSTLTLAGAETVDDQITMRVYRGAATKTVKWYRDGAEIPGETGMSLTATEPGIYKAVFTAVNTAGEIQGTSNEVTISSPPAPTPTPGPDPGPSPIPTPSNSFSAVSAAESSGSVVTVARVPGAGKLRQVATRASGGKRVSVCSSSRTATSAGRFRLECKPSAATRRAQKKGRVRVTVRVTYTPAGGTARTVTRYVWLRSLKPQFTG